jgi:NTP pyrophosphatase (non-canonical NTP hydrolase)
MTYSFSDYTNDTTFTRELGNPISPGYAILGLLGETGEVLEAAGFYDDLFDCPDTLVGHLMDAENMKKDVRTGKTKAPQVELYDKTDVKKELGDVLWYLNTLALSLGFTLEEVALLNVEKLQKRHQQSYEGIDHSINPDN